MFFSCNILCMHSLKSLSCLEKKNWQITFSTTQWPGMGQTKLICMVTYESYTSFNHRKDCIMRSPSIPMLPWDWAFSHKCDTSFLNCLMPRSKPYKKAPVQTGLPSAWYLKAALALFLPFAVVSSAAWHAAKMLKTSASPSFPILGCSDASLQLHLRQNVRDTTSAGPHAHRGLT